MNESIHINSKGKICLSYARDFAFIRMLKELTQMKNVKRILKFYDKKLFYATRINMCFEKMKIQISNDDDDSKIIIYENEILNDKACKKKIMRNDEKKKNRRN